MSQAPTDIAIIPDDQQAGPSRFRVIETEQPRSFPDNQQAAPSNGQTSEMEQPRSAGLPLQQPIRRHSPLGLKLSAGSGSSSLGSHSAPPTPLTPRVTIVERWHSDAASLDEYNPMDRHRLEKRRTPQKKFQFPYGPYGDDQTDMPPSQSRSQPKQASPIYDFEFKSGDEGKGLTAEERRIRYREKQAREQMKRAWFMAGTVTVLAIASLGALGTASYFLYKYFTED